MKKLTFHRNPAERTLVEKIARRFILPPHGPKALPMGRWGVREERLKRTFPIRFFIWDTVPDFWRYQISNRYKRGKNWVRYRTWDRYDIVKLEVEKTYHDPDYRLLHANFQLLKDFVEIELASMMDASDERNNEEIDSFLKRVGKHIRFRRRKMLRSPEQGIKHLDWEIEETTGHQKTSAVEKKELYLWWTQYRPLRADPYDSALFKDPNDNGEPWSLATMVRKPFNRPLAEARQALENMYEAEDEEMLIRLMKVRRSLWS